MKINLFWVVAAIVIILTCSMFGFLFMRGYKFYTSDSLPITVREVRPNIFCATMAKPYAVAIDCWKETDGD